MARFRQVGTLLLLLVLTAATALAGGDFSLTILHTNDIHAHLASFDEYGAFCPKEKEAAGKCLGGAARLATAVARERAKGGPFLLLDAGDQFQGTLFFTKYKGEACAFFMDRLGYDAMALGNHEFDDGPGTLANFIRSLKFPMLAANVNVEKSKELKGLVAPYVVREIDGRKVGIVGATQPKADRISSPGPDVSFPAFIASLEKAVAAVKAQGADIVIVLSHAGLTGDKKLAASVPGIDVIVGGHSHVLLGNGYPEAVGPCPLAVDGPDGGKAYIVTAGYWGRYLGVLHVDFDAAGAVAKAWGNPVALNAAMPEDPATLAEVERFAKPLEAYRKTVLGRTVAAVGAAMCRQEECAGGDLMAEALLAGGKSRGAVAAIYNGGGVRAGIAPGEVTLGDLLTAFPFPNTLVVATLSGRDLLAVLEHGVSAVGLHEGSGRFPQVAGIRFAYDLTRPVGKRVTGVEVADAAGRFALLDPKADYRLAVTDFMFRGGDGYVTFGQKARDVDGDGDPIADLAAAWVRAHTPLDIKLDGRITASGVQ
ncbi:MAG: bifunctional metallophosphatase/5'-nucleotidase [Solidesulfovibrio sp. DCME]|uniref:bifunctional metallophosphatase/5'-nucleotidase n=1 Tax=Solidesulfovibrio sp. DCME TaxID=3447380 RepID=UPI003D10A9B3